MMTLSLEAYRKAVRIDEIFHGRGNGAPTTEEIDRILDGLLDFLIAEGGGGPGFSAPKVRLRLLRALLTVRPPLPLPDRFWSAMDRLQEWEAARKKIVNGASIQRICSDIPGSRYPAADRCALWQGDVTILKADAIVNAANAGLLGCFAPFHACIDNAIHWVAGPRLRRDCRVIMEMQGHPEKSGQAKITRGYHLPARYVLHTVGPVYEGPQSLPEKTDQLAACYRACLDLGSRIEQLETIAFCSISTGVYGFPPNLAARIALDTVARWMAEHAQAMTVIFNVFSDSDHALYREMISGWMSPNEALPGSCKHEQGRM
jgi:O-acetyl-ADP-ribose deacetylase (regulator of RNase III)